MPPAGSFGSLGLAQSAWMCRGTLPTFAQTTWKPSFHRPDSPWCVASISPGADDLAALASSLVPALDPKARRVRAIPETGLAKLLKDLLYSALLAGTIPFTLLEAGCHAGSNFMIEARKKP